jgi:sugar/nucleoside kinase (ribokinase family)
MFDIISIGSAVLDVILKSPNLHPGEPLPVGGKVEIEDLFIASGGGGSNTAAGFARLGLKTACIARFGDDLFGHFLSRELAKEKFDQKYLMPRKGDRTDYSTIILYSDGSRVILVHRGKTRIEETIFPWSALDETKWFYIASLEGNVDLLTKVIGKSAEKGIKIALNPGSRELKEKDKLLSVFPKTEALIINLEEAILFTGEQVEDLALKKISQIGPKIVVVTQGKDGAHLFSQGKHLFSPIFKHETVDELGAGDGFSGGFVSGLVKGFQLEKCLKTGMANGASVVTKIGSKPGLLDEKGMEEWLGQDLKIEQLS